MGAIFKTPKNINKKMRYTLHWQIGRIAVADKEIFNTIKEHMPEVITPEYNAELAEYLERVMINKIPCYMEEHFNNDADDCDKGSALMCIIEIAMAWIDWTQAAELVIDAIREAEWREENE